MFGRGTESKVKAFQTSKSLEVDGVVGKATLQALRSNGQSAGTGAAETQTEPESGAAETGADADAPAQGGDNTATEGGAQTPAETGTVKKPNPSLGLAAQDPTVLFAMNLYAEARGEFMKHGDDALYGVAQVVYNRKLIGRWGGSFSDVILAPYQFSWTRAGEPNQAAALNPTSEKAWNACYRVAREVMGGGGKNPVGAADHYHATYVSPAWANPAKKTAQIGVHIFYDLESKDNRLRSQAPVTGEAANDEGKDETTPDAGGQQDAPAQAQEGSGADQSQPAQQDQPAPVASTIGTATITASALRIRAQASTSSSILGTLRKNETVQVISEEGDWYKIKHGNSEAFIFARYATLKGGGSADAGTADPQQGGADQTQTPAQGGAQDTPAAGGQEQEPAATDIPEGNVTANFAWSEFTSKGDGKAVPSNLRSNVQKLCEQLEIIRREAGGKSIRINSGYRSPYWNGKVGGATNSQHLYGKAADIVVSGMSAAAVHSLVKRLINEGKIEQGGLGKYNSFTHYDIRGTAARW